MINDKKMKFIKSENNVNFYLFKPSIFKLYYDDNISLEVPAHRNTFSHKIHMFSYILFGGGYRILYLEKDGEILSYIAFTKAKDWIVKNSKKNDYYTIFLWTYPKHRSRGLATIMSKTMLEELSLNYNLFYKTISTENISSIKVAQKCGFELKCNAKKKGFLHTIYENDKGNLYLYCKANNIT